MEKDNRQLLAEKIEKEAIETCTMEEFLSVDDEGDNENA